MSSPGPAGGPPVGALSDHRAWLVDLLRSAVRMFTAHLWMFVAIAGGVVAVVDLILGVGLGELTSRYQAKSSNAESLITLAASAFVTTPLITAMLAQAVVEIVGGRQPSAAEAIQRGLDLFAVMLFAIVLYVAGVVAGIFAFVVPGIYVGVCWYFVAQAVVVDDCRGTRALARSAELVRGSWWRALTAGLVFNVSVWIPSVIVTFVFDAAARAANAEGLLVLGDIVYQAFALPFVAIGATLFYLQLRDRQRAARVGP